MAKPKTVRERLIGKPLIGFEANAKRPSAMGGAEAMTPPAMVGVTEAKAPRAMVGQIEISAPRAMVGAIE